MHIEFERDMWKQRTKQAVMLLLEARDRLEGNLPAYAGVYSDDRADAVAQWIRECFPPDSWMSQVKSMSRISHSRLKEIDEAIEAAV